MQISKKCHYNLETVVHLTPMEFDFITSAEGRRICDRFHLSVRLSVELSVDTLSQKVIIIY